MPLVTDRVAQLAFALRGISDGLRGSLHMSSEHLSKGSGWVSSAGDPPIRNAALLLRQTVIVTTLRSSQHVDCTERRF